MSEAIFYRSMLDNFYPRGNLGAARGHPGNDNQFGKQAHVSKQGKRQKPGDGWMNALLGVWVVFILLLLLPCQPASATATSSVGGVAPLEILVYVDGQVIHFQDQQPYIDENNRTLVPVRFPAEHLGATVAWDETNRQVTIEQEETGSTVKFWLDRLDYLINDEVKEMDTAPVLTPAPARVMVPLRFISEALDVDITWHFEDDINTGFIFNFTDNQPELEQMRMMNEIIRESIKSKAKPPELPSFSPPNPIPENPPVPIPKRPMIPFPGQRQERESTEPAIPTPSRPSAPTAPEVN